MKMLMTICSEDRQSEESSQETGLRRQNDEPKDIFDRINRIIHNS
jgi:hypothetical protein